MRSLVKNADDSFCVKAYAGTNSVLLAFHVADHLKPGLLGFAIEQQEEGKPRQWLWNKLTFPGVAHVIKKWNATPSNLAPIQKFRWADYSIEPGTTCRYRVHLAHAAAGSTTPQLGQCLEVEVRTDDGKPAGQAVNFNRAVTASQAFGIQFSALDDQLNKNKSLPVEQWSEAPRRWLEHGLLQRLLDFIARAEGPEWALDVAIYEYELKSIVDAVNAAHGRGVNVRVLYHARKNDPQTVQNETNLQQIPAAKKLGRITPYIFHDKFIVLSKVQPDGSRSPQAVLCGSTNFTENGVYRQANVVHVIDKREFAARYLELFDVIWQNHDDVGATRRWINRNNPVDSSATSFVGFSPRTHKEDLAEFIRIIQAAQRDVLFATAFRLPDAILEALLGQPHDPILRYGIQNTASKISGFHADRTAEFTTPALLTSGLEGWVKEGLKGQRGRLLVHTKVVVVDFTSENPTIISGSHNLSNPASHDNDENYLILKGDTDLADRYGLEVLRFYEHYRFRYYAKLLKFKKAKPLATDDSWAKLYYTPGHLKQAARLRFAGL